LTSYSWCQIISSGPLPRSQHFHTTPPDSPPLGMIVSGQDAFGDVRRALHNETSAPHATSFHSATVHGNEMVVFGGQSMPGPGAVAPRIVHGEVWCFDLAKETWRKPEFEHACVASRRRPLGMRLWPEPRWMHSQVKLDETHLLIIGEKVFVLFPSCLENISHACHTSNVQLPDIKSRDWRVSEPQTTDKNSCTRKRS
jgi:hypothetical protein